MSELDKVSGDYRLDLCSLLLESDNYVVIIEHPEHGLIAGQASLQGTDKLIDKFKATQWKEQK